MGLDIVFIDVEDTFPYEELHNKVKDSFKFQMLQKFNYGTINREVVEFEYYPQQQKFKLKTVKPIYKYKVEVTIERNRILKEQMI